MWWGPEQTLYIAKDLLCFFSLVSLNYFNHLYFQGGAGDNLESKWFRSSSALEYQKPDEGEDWNSYFQYTAHKNILKELHEE